MARRVLLLALTLALTAVGAADAGPRRVPRPTVVVAVADSGINPYHEAFYRPKNTAHPCTYVAGFDCSVPALPLSVGKHKDYAAAVAADKAVWESVDPHTWYWIPRTNIIGAVCDTPYSGRADNRSSTCILDENGHGTGTASSVLSEAPDALLLVHEGYSSGSDLETAPVVPDVQSHSWAAPAPVPAHLTEPVLPDSGGICDTQRRPETLFFLAAGNEAPFPVVLDCWAQHSDVHTVGGAYPGYWTHGSWSTFDFASWYCRPVAVHEATKGTDESCGTSFAAPTAAGAVAAALLRLRREDRYAGRNTMARVSRTVTRAAFEQALRDAATYTPKPKFTSGQLCTDYVLCVVTSAYGRVAPLPGPAAHVFWGYGWLDSTVTGAIVACARGGACPEKSAEAQRWNDARQQTRTVTERPSVVRPVAQRDAGTKRDAGDERRTAIAIRPGRAYTATIDPYVTGGDLEDWYAFRAATGQRISVTATASLHPSIPADASPVVGCWFVVTPEGFSVDSDGTGVGVYRNECDSAGTNAPLRQVEAPSTGTYYLVYHEPRGLPRHDYRFTLTLAR